MASALPVDAASRAPRRADPVTGPNAAEASRHRGQVSYLAPQRGLARSVDLAPRAPQAGLRREVFGFAPYWELGTSGSWDLGLLTTVSYFGVDINGDGSLSTSGPGWAGWNSGQLTDLVNRAHRQGVRVVLTIKQFDEGTINGIVTSQPATAAAVQHTVDAVASRGLDGVNVDFEGSSSPSYPGIQAGTTHFMAALSGAVHARWPGAEVSMDTYSGSASWDGGLFKIGDLASHVDAFFIMAYDMAPSNMPGQAGPNAPMAGFTYNDTLAVSQYLAKAPASKVILGVPYYGYKWSTQGNGLYAKASGGAMADSYAGILQDMGCAHMTHNYDGRSQTPWNYWFSPASGDPCGANRNSWRELYYDDAGSLGLKYDLVNGRGLRGAGIWALGYDNGSRDLWNELAAKFR